MSIESELFWDRDKCAHCGKLLCEHFGGKRTREVLRELDEEELCIARVIDILCGACGGISELFYSADPL